MKKLSVFLCLLCMTAALTVPASAAGPLEYTIDAPGDPDYGVPTSIAGEGHVCGFAAFEKGQKYPTVHLDRIQGQLANLSRAIAEAVESRFKELHDVYVPLSMALLTSYDETYLGIGPAPREKA